MGKNQSKQQNKPILFLFQEISGCQGCKDYGKNVLSSEAICTIIVENFIPIAIYNNRGGKDGEIRSSFKDPEEKAWDYPSLRIVDHDLKDLTDQPRLYWSSGKTENVVKNYLTTTLKKL